MKNLLIVTALMLSASACGNTYVPPIVGTQGFAYVPQNPIVNTPQQQFPNYYCYMNGMVVRRNTYHPRFQQSWVYAPREVCL